MDKLQRINELDCRLEYLRNGHRSPYNRIHIRRVDSTRTKLSRLYEAARGLYEDCITFTRMMFL